jgi:hypothetical protein
VVYVHQPAGCVVSNSNNKAFGVNDLKPNQSHLIPGKSGDGVNADPLTTGKHSRQEVDELKREGQEARGEKPANAVELIKEVIANPVPFRETIIEHKIPSKVKTLEELERDLDELKDKIAKAFKHAGFNF